MPPGEDGNVSSCQHLLLGFGEVELLSVSDLEVLAVAIDSGGSEITIADTFRQLFPATVKTTIICVKSCCWGLVF